MDLFPVGKSKRLALENRYIDCDYLNLIDNCLHPVCFFFNFGELFNLGAMKLKITLFLALFCITHMHAQEILWNVGLKSVFDNREYESKLNRSQTIFGATLSPELGVRWGEKNSLMVGAYVTSEFGSPTKDISVDPAFYYNYKDKNFNISAGIVPFSQVIGTESRAFFSDSIRFFKHSIGGVLLQYVKGKNYAEIYCDWDGRQSDTSREKFTLYSSGRITKNILFATYELSIHHHAGTANGGGVADNIWINPALGVDVSHRLWLDSLTIGVGYLQSFQKDRSFADDYVKPKGAEINIRLEKCKFGIYNTLFVGNNMMPYFEKYNSSLYWGDSFYSTPHNVYNRAEIYWMPLRNKNFNLKVASVHHYDGKTWSWQQLVNFNVRIDQNIFKKKKVG